MDLFGIGTLELILIFIVVLLVLGPHRLPEIARTIGRTISTIRKASMDVSQQVSKELQVQEPAPAPAPAKENKASPQKE